MREFKKPLLLRWISLRDGTGVAQIRTRIRTLWSLGFFLFAGAALSAIFHLDGWVTLGLALGAGWVIAEVNALRSRLSQWPTLSEYIDWQRVKGDLGDAP
jgi:hypothetical protein